MSTATLQVLTIAQAAERIGVKEWQVGRLFERGFLPTPPKLGPYRVIHVDTLPEVAAAARRAGYLRDEPSAA